MDDFPVSASCGFGGWDAKLGLGFLRRLQFCARAACIDGLSLMEPATMTTETDFTPREAAEYCGHRLDIGEGS